MLNSFGGSPEVDLVVKAVDQTQGAFNSVNGALGVLAAGAVIVTAAVTAVGAAIVQVTKVTLAWGTSLNDTKLKLGDTTAQAAGLQLAADAVGLSMDQVTGAFMRLDKGLETANGKAGASAKILDDLGIAWKNTDGTMKDSTSLLQSVADWFAKTTDITARNNMELSIFGRSGADVDRMLMNLSGGGMQTYIDQAKKFGLVLKDDQLNKIQAVSEQMNILKDAFKGAEVTLGVTFLPVLQNLVTWFGNLLAAEMPAITQFGQFLGMLTGGKTPALSAPSGGGGATQSGVYGGTGSASDQAWRDYWNNKGPKPVAGAPIGGGGGGGTAGIPSQGPANQGHGESITLTPLELTIMKMTKSLSGIPWDKFSTALSNFVTNIHWDVIGDDFNKLGDTVNKIGDAIQTGANAALAFETGVGIFQSAVESLWNLILGKSSSATTVQKVTGKATGGSFTGWAMVGDAPGGGVTPFTEYVHAPHGATVYNQRQMAGLSGGGSIPPDSQDGTRHFNYGTVHYHIGTAQPNDWLQATRQ